MTKKAIEMSMNFLVTVIIGITVLGLGVKFISDLASDATSMESLTADQIDKRIGDLLCDSGDRVCIGTNKKVISKGEFDVFGIKIVNILDSQQFNIQINNPIPSGYTKKNVPIQTNNIDLKYRNTVFIEKNAEEDMGIGVEVPKNADSGTYIYNAAVCYDDKDGVTDDIECTISPYLDLYSFNKLYVEVP